MDIEARLADLERRQRNRPWWALAGFAASLTLGAMLGAAGGSVPKEVRARSFVLEGPDGKVVADWFFQPNSDPKYSSAMLVFHDGQGRPRLNIGCLRSGYASISAESGGEGVADDSSVQLRIDEDNVPEIVIKGKDGRPVFTRP